MTAFDDVLARLKAKVIPDDCVVMFCSACRDTGFRDVPDPKGREGAVLVRPCRECGHLPLSDHRARWRRADEETQRNAREWRSSA